MTRRGPAIRSRKKAQASTRHTRWRRRWDIVDGWRRVRASRSETTHSSVTYFWGLIRDSVPEPTALNGLKVTGSNRTSSIFPPPLSRLKVRGKCDKYRHIWKFVTHQRSAIWHLDSLLYQEFFGQFNEFGLTGFGCWDNAHIKLPLQYREDQ